MISYGANFSPFTVTDFFLLVPETNPKNPPVADLGEYPESFRRQI